MLNRFDNRECGCIVRGDGMWLRFCSHHGNIHRGILFSRHPGLNKDGSEKRHRGQNHTNKTHGSDSRRLANHHARERAMGNMSDKQGSAKR